MPPRRSSPRRFAKAPRPRTVPVPHPRHAGAAPTAGAWWRHPAFGAALVAFLIYVPGLSGGFLRDDHFLIEQHPYLRATGWLGRLLLSDFWEPVSGATGMWRPLVVLSYWVDGRLGGWSPFWFHVVNAAAHALATGALALLVAASGAGAIATWLAALAFATMPAHVECVAWISGRTDVFCALFGLAALWLDARARRAGRPWPGVLAPVALGLAMLSKEVGLPVLGVLAVQEWVRTRTETSPWRSLRWLVPYAAVTAVYVVLHLAMAPDPGVPPSSDARGPTSGGAAWALVPGYVAFLWPWFPHSPDRAAPAFAADARLQIAFGALAVVVLAALLIVLVWRRSRHAAPVALALFPLAPTLALASARGFGLFGERHMYVPSAGVVWALALALPVLASRVGGRVGMRVATAIAAFLVVGGAIETSRTIPDYHDDRTMYEAMTERDPGNPAGFLGLAVVRTERGELDGALAMLDRAERLDPRLSAVSTGRARVAARRDAWGDVLRESGRALALDPRLQPARLLHAVALMRLGRLPEAGGELEGLRRDYPDHPGIATVWGQYLAAVGRPADALPVLLEATRLLPNESSLWDAIGLAHAALGHREEARAAFERVVVLTPEFLEGWMRLAASCHRLGDAAGRNRALARAAELPGGRARVEEFLAPLGAGAR